MGPIVGKECEECGFKFKIGGPIWSKPMHDAEFIGGLLSDIKSEKLCYVTVDRIIGKVSCWNMCVYIIIYVALLFTPVTH